MATVEVNLGERKLTAQQTKILEDKFNKKTVTVEYANEDLDLDGNFADAAKWKTGLWDSICTELGLKNVPSKTIKSSLADPTDCALAIETWDQNYKGKLAFKAKAGDKTQRVIKKHSKPPHVKVKPAGAKLADCPAQFQADLKDLLGKMQKTASYEYVGGSGSNKGWSINIDGHQTHEQPGKGWKAYIDEPTMKTGTTWRLYFGMDFDTASQTLTLSLTDVQEDH